MYIILELMILKFLKRKMVEFYNGKLYNIFRKILFLYKFKFVV